MIKSPIILWIILAIQLVFLAMFIFNIVKFSLDGVFIPMFAVNFVFSLVLIWLNISHIQVLAKLDKPDANPFS